MEKECCWLRRLGRKQWEEEGIPCCRPSARLVRFPLPGLWALQISSWSACTSQHAWWDLSFYLFLSLSRTPCSRIDTRCAWPFQTGHNDQWRLPPDIQAITTFYLCLLLLRVERDQLPPLSGSLSLIWHFLQHKFQTRSWSIWSMNHNLSMFLSNVWHFSSPLSSNCWKLILCSSVFQTDVQVCYLLLLFL